MKLKSHSGMKKRVKAKKHKLMMQKSCKRHLLANKSKRQKGASARGMSVSNRNIKNVKKMVPYA